MNKEKILNVMLLLTIAGAFLSFYLYYTDVINAPVLCPNGGCAKVASSEYSRFLGIPVSLWGLSYYLCFSLLLILREKGFIFKYFNHILTAFVLAGITFTIYLRVIEFVVIKALCVWCWGSVLIIGGIFILYLLLLKNQKGVDNVT